MLTEGLLSTLKITSAQDLIERANEVTEVMLSMDNVECPVYHNFGPGIYVREVHLPKGAFVVGFKHKQPHLNIYLKGSMELLTDDGLLQTMHAPQMLTAPAGRKMAFIHEDSVWLNLYPTDIQDVDTLEEMFLDKGPVWGDRTESTYKMDFTRMKLEHAAFNTLKHETGFSGLVLDEVPPLPHGSYVVKVAPSPIEGKGLFATANIELGNIIVPARVGGNWTIGAKYPNHSLSPNAIMHKQPNDDIVLVAIKPIQGCKGGYTGDEITLDYREVLNVTGGNTCQE